MLIDSGVRKADWIIEKHSNKKLVTSLGMVSFKKTLFTNRNTQESHYLLDQILGLESHERMTEDAEVRMFQEAVQTSYRRGGEETSLTDSVSKQTVKNKIHRLRFPENKEKPDKKKEIPIAVGAEEVVTSAEQMLRSEKRTTKKNGKYIDIMQHRVSNQLQKKVMFQYHIWDL